MVNVDKTLIAPNFQSFGAARAGFCLQYQYFGLFVKRCCSFRRLLITSFLSSGAHRRSQTPFPDDRAISPLRSSWRALFGKVHETRPAGSERLPSPGESFDSSVTATARMHLLLIMVVTTRPILSTLAPACRSSRAFSHDSPQKTVWRSGRWRVRRRKQIDNTEGQTQPFALQAVGTFDVSGP